MTWARLDDGLDEHPKVDELLDDDELRGLAAIGLWVLTLTYASRNETDGVLPGRAVKRIAPKHGARLAKRLVDAGMYDEHDERGLSIHDFLDHNPSAMELAERRRKEAERKAHARGGKSGGSPRGVPPGQKPESAGTPNGSPDVSRARVDPTRPDPTTPPTPQGGLPFPESPGRGARQRDKERHEASVTAWLTEHLPGRSVFEVSSVVSSLRNLGTVPFPGIVRDTLAAQDARKAAAA